MEWKTTSIGSICFCKWHVCLKLGIPYIATPFDNVQNLSDGQFDNIRLLLEKDYAQLTETTLERRDQPGSRIVDGLKVLYKGYKYVGDDLAKEFILAHFFDDTKPNAWLDNAAAWERWRHKCDTMRNALSDTSNGLFLVSLRLNNGAQKDTLRRRDILAASLRRLAALLRDRYGRTQSDCRILSIVACSDIPSTTVEVDEPLFRQIAVPAGDEADTPYWHRQPRQEYIDLAKEYMAEFNH